MKFKLIESYDDALFYKDKIDVGLSSESNPIMSYFDFYEILKEHYSEDELLEILMDNNYIHENEDLFDVMSYKMNVLDYYSIPEFKEIMDNEVFPEVDRQLQDEEDFEAEFGSEGNFYKRLDQDR